MGFFISMPLMSLCCFEFQCLIVITDEKTIPCSCGAGLMHLFTSNTKKNPNPMFYKCPKFQKHPGSFIWVDTLTSADSSTTQSYTTLLPPSGDEAKEKKATSSPSEASSSKAIPDDEIIKTLHRIAIALESLEQFVRTFVLIAIALVIVLFASFAM